MGLFFFLFCLVNPRLISAEDKQTSRIDSLIFSPPNKDAYLNQLEQEWLGIGKIMKEYGFNVNFGPVVDVAEGIEDRDIYLGRRYRLYSEDPNKVVELASRVVEGLDKAGIIPVLKHFPGLGGVRADTHIQLPIFKKTKAGLYNEDLKPFKNLIKKYPNLWVMVDHVIYPCLSDKPASVSYDIQTSLLREELGFKGIIIADELLNMQALLEFAYREKIQEPFIGEIIVRVFQAGTDIALIYPHPKKAEGIISHIIQSVIKAISEGRLKVEDIDSSLERILKEKERIFGVPLLQLAKDMPLEEKICQKIALDMYDDTKLLNKYNLCGIHPRVELDLKALQKQVKIPLFIMAQHEGGMVNERLLKVSTQSAYVVGREYERLTDKNAKGDSSAALPERSLQKRRRACFSGAFGERALQRKRRACSPNRPKNMQRADYDKAISSLLVSIDKLIELFSELKQKSVIFPPNPNYLTPLTVNSDNSFELKPFTRLPVVWLRSFPNEDIGLYTYKIFKSIYYKWIKSQDAQTISKYGVVQRLISLREQIKKANEKK